MKIITLITSNSSKAKEYRSLFKEKKLDLYVKNIKYDEIQSTDINRIILTSLSLIKTIDPIIIDDTLFEIPSLKNFPCFYSKYIIRSIGSEGIIKLMKGKKDRSAKSVTGIGYKDKNGVEVFLGEAEFNIANSVCKQHYNSNMFDNILLFNKKRVCCGSVKEKGEISHRGKAFKSLYTFLKYKEKK